MPRNVIVLLGDGVGAAHWEAARMRAGGALSLDALEGPVLYATSSLSLGVPTDSAASATALATGQCTTNGRVGVDALGRALPNLFELAARDGKRTGLATNTVLIDASPMAFAVHSPSRYCDDELGAQLLSTVGLDVALGGFVPDSAFTEGGLSAPAMDAGWRLVSERAQLLESDAGEAPVLGLFGAGPSVAAWPDWEYGLTPEVLREQDSDEPTLAELTGFALERLASAPDGFVLMVENEHPDTVGHVAHLDPPLAAEWMPGLVLELDAALARVLEWVQRQSSFEETLVVVCSDHETGGYTLSSGGSTAGSDAMDDGGTDTANDTDTDADAGAIADADVQPRAAGSFPAAPNHTTARVPIYARGPGSERLQDVTHVSDIFHLLTGNLDALPGTGSCP